MQMMHTQAPPVRFKISPHANIARIKKIKQPKLRLARSKRGKINTFSLLTSSGGGGRERALSSGSKRNGAEAKEMSRSELKKEGLFQV
jgi:hypothetical protein